MGMETFGRNDEEEQDLAGVELTPGERHVDGFRDDIINGLSAETKLPPERAFAILGSMKKVKSDARTGFMDTTYTLSDKGHSIDLWFGIVGHNGQLASKFFEVLVDGKSVPESKLQEIINFYKPFTEAYDKLADSPGKGTVELVDRIEVLDDLMKV